MSSSTRPAPSRPQARLEQFTSSLHLDELLRMIWRHRTLLVGTVFTLTTLAIIVSYQLTPRYTADASVMALSRSLLNFEKQASLGFESRPRS